MAGFLSVGHPHAVLAHRPIEEPGEDLAVAVGGLGCESPAGNLAADEGCDLGRRDLLEACGFNHLSFSAAVLAFFRRTLLGFQRYNSARHFNCVADRAEGVSEP